FQAEDGIRDFHVTGVQTCALPIFALLAGLGREEEFRLHVRATRNTGASAEDIAELLLHVAVYAGVPAANSAMRIAKQLLAELDRSEEHTSELQSRENLVCRLLLEK